MLDVFLDKLEVDNADMLYVQHPSMVEVSWPLWLPSYSRTKRLDLRELFLPKITMRNEKRARFWLLFWGFLEGCYT